MEYDGWPIARLIDRELGSFSLFKTIKTIASVDKPEDITVRWTRDVWVGSKLPPNYPEHLILCESASELTEDRWRTNLFEAQRCLDPKRDFRGRARQSITLQGGTKDLYVSPHLGFVLELWRGKPQSEAGLIEPMQEAKRQLLPIYRMIADLSQNTNITVAEAQRDIEAVEAEEKYEEGGRSPVLVNHYERNAALRAAAISIHGTRCWGCGFSFQEVYGKHGAGYIEVHHLRPVSSYIGKVTVVPRTDMAVLCSNCHRMVHHHPNSPLSLEQLRMTLRK